MEGESPIAWAMLLVFALYRAFKFIQQLLTYDEAREAALEAAHKEWEAEFW